MCEIGSREWITATIAAKELGCPFQAIRRIARAGHITIREIPGCDPLYLASDVSRLAEASTRPATRLAEATGAAAG